MSQQPSADIQTARSISVAFKADISRIVKYAPAELIGREADTKLLNDAWEKVVSGETKRPGVPYLRRVRW